MKVPFYILFLVSPLLGFTQTTPNLIMNNSFEYLNRTSPFYSSTLGGGINDTNLAKSVLPCWTIANTTTGTAEILVTDPSLSNLNPYCLNCYPFPENQNQIIWLPNNFHNIIGRSRNYIENTVAQTKLYNPLIAGIVYRLSGYLNTITNTDTINTPVLINGGTGAEFNKIGFYFSILRPFDTMTNLNASVFYSIRPTIEYSIRHIAQDNSIQNPWQRFDLVFTATGGEIYLTFGNFDSTANNCYVYPLVDSFLHRHLLIGQDSILNANIDTYFDNLTLVPISDTSLTVINPHIGDPDSILGPADTLSCNNATITISAGTDFLTYNWSTGATTRTIQVSTPGTYTVTVNNGCGVYADTIHVMRDTTTRPNYHIRDTAICSDQHLTYTLPNSLGVGHVLWSNGDTILQSTFGTGTYDFSYSNQCFQYSDTFAIKYDGADTINLFADTLRTICPGASFTLSPMNSYPTYTWSDQSSGPSLTVMQAGYFSLTVIDPLGCRISDTIHYAQPLLPTTLLTQDSIRKCASDYPITITAEAGFSQYYWNGLPGTSQYIVTAPDVTVYASATTLCGTVRDTFTAYSIHDLTGIAYTIDSDCTQNIATITLSTIGSPSVLWSNGFSGDQVTVSLPQKLIVQALYTCTAIADTIILPGCAFFAHTLSTPNAFSPNGDGINDYFEIFGDKYNIKYLSVTIFDRWGEKVFESNDISFRWDGRFRGASLDGVLVYDIAVVYTDEKVSRSKGSITVIR